MESALTDLVELRGKLYKQYPKCQLEVYYDWENLVRYDAKIKRNKKKLFSLLSSLCRYKSGIRIYLRIHGYKGWLVVRVSVNTELPCRLEKRLKRKNGIMSIEKGKSGSVIKFIL